MELADRRRRVGAQRVEKRCGETVPQAGEHGAVQVGDVVEPVERPVVGVGLGVVAGRDRLVGEQIEIDVGAQFPDPLAALHPVVGAVGDDLAGRLVGPEQRVHQRQPVFGPQRQVVADDRGLDLAVQRDRGDGILDARDDEDLELHVVGRVAQIPQALGQAVGSRRGGVVGEQHGVELLLPGAGHQLLVRQRRRRVEKPGAVAVFGEQAHGQRHLLGEPHRGQALQVRAEGRQVLRAGIQPVPLVRADAVHQAFDPGDVVGLVVSRQVDLGEMTAGVVEHVPGVDPRVRRVGHRRQRGHPQPPWLGAVEIHHVTCPASVLLAFVDGPATTIVTPPRCAE